MGTPPPSPFTSGTLGMYGGERMRLGLSLVWKRYFLLAFSLHIERTNGGQHAFYLISASSSSLGAEGVVDMRPRAGI